MPNIARQGDMEKKIAEMEKSETEKVFEKLVMEDPGISLRFKDSFFQKAEALNGRR